MYINKVIEAITTLLEPHSVSESYLRTSFLCEFWKKKRLDYNLPPTITK